jgi:hypothetical protein
MTGAFYELHKPMAGFEGKHTIAFTSFDNEEYKEEFTFRALSLLSEIPETISRDTLMLQLQGPDPIDSIRIVMTDTSRLGDGVNILDSVVNGRLVLTKDDFAELANGPVQLELILEKEIPIKNSTNAGGRIYISYSIRREFMLQDKPE